MPNQTEDSSSLDRIQARIREIGDELTPYEIGEIPWDERCDDLKEELHRLLGRQNELLNQN